MPKPIFYSEVARCRRSGLPEQKDIRIPLEPMRYSCVQSCFFLSSVLSIERSSAKKTSQILLEKLSFDSRAFDRSDARLRQRPFAPVRWMRLDRCRLSCLWAYPCLPRAFRRFLISVSQVIGIAAFPTEGSLQSARPITSGIGSQIYGRRGRSHIPQVAAHGADIRRGSM